MVRDCDSVSVMCYEQDGVTYSVDITPSGDEAMMVNDVCAELEQLKRDDDDGTNGQDRDNYSDTQDRDNYTVDPALEQESAITVLPKDDWYVDDWSGFGDMDLQDKTLSEVAAICRAFDAADTSELRHMDADIIGTLIDDMGADEFASFIEYKSYEGRHDSTADFAETYFKDVYSVPESVEPYIDWDAVWHGEFSHDYDYHTHSNGDVFIFRVN